MDSINILISCVLKRLEKKRPNFGEKRKFENVGEVPISGYFGQAKVWHNSKTWPILVIIPKLKAFRVFSYFVVHSTSILYLLYAKRKKKD